MVLSRGLYEPRYIVVACSKGGYLLVSVAPAPALMAQLRAEVSIMYAWRPRAKAGATFDFSFVMASLIVQDLIAGNCNSKTLLVEYALNFRSERLR